MPEPEAWPDDLEAVLVDARDAYLADPAPTPSPEVLAFLEVPAHGRVDAEGMMLPSDPHPIELEVLPTRGWRVPPRFLVAASGAAAALVLVVLAIRPALTNPSIHVSAPTSAPRSSATTGASSARVAGANTFTPSAVVVVPDGPATGGLADGVDTTLPATTVAPPTAGPPTTVKSSSSSKTSPSKRPATRTEPVIVPVAPSSQQAVLAYYEAANVRGKCVAQHPTVSDRAELIALCGAEPQPPDNLVLYWAAKDTWNSCAVPLQGRGWTASKVVSECGAKPNRTEYQVPVNPYSRSG